MTIRETLQKYLVSRGLWPNESEQVIEAYRVSEESAGESDHRLDDDLEGYPPQFVPVLFVAIAAEAVVWIDANKPKHFARRMFAK